MRTVPRSKNQKVSSKAPQLSNLSLADVRRLPKPHIGFEKFVEPMANVAETYAAEIGTAGIDVQAMREGLAHYQVLEAEHEAALAHLALIENTRLKYSSQVWVQELTIYGHARVAARTNKAIAAAVDAFERFMKHGPRTKKPSGGGSGGNSGTP